MNVLLVPAHPGFPGQIPQSRKTVVCVFVCVCNKMATNNSRFIKLVLVKKVSVTVVCHHFPFCSESTSSLSLDVSCGDR